MAAASTPTTVETGVAGSGAPLGRAATTVTAAAAAGADTEAATEVAMAPDTAASMAEGAAAAVAAGIEREVPLANGILNLNHD
jgi:H+/Cl- antiporter ClcA